MTLAELRALLRLTLSSTAAWPDGTLDRWIGSAIALYSAHFPRRVRAEMALAAGTQAYALPGGVSGWGVIAVEYPAGQVPPRFLRPAAEWSPTDWSAEFAAGSAGGMGRYAIRGAGEDEAGAAGYIVFAETVRDGETALVEYWGPHPAPAVGDDAAVITLPGQHLEAITAYAAFAAHYELETDAALAADGSTIVLAQLGEESRRAWLRYKEVMDRLAWLGGPANVPMPAWGGIGL